MKAGSAQKMVLNLLTTTAMIRLGKVYENMMIDLQQNSQKLVERSKKIIMMSTDKSYDEATHYLELTNGHVKSSILMALTDLDPASVKRLLDKNDGFIKKSLMEWRESK